MDSKCLERLANASRATGYRESKADAERSVVAWRWATGRAFTTLPFWVELNQAERGKVLPSEPRRKKDTYSFGFDGHDRLRVVRRFGKEDKPEYEIFTTFRDDIAVERGFPRVDGRIVLGTLTEIVFEANRPVESRQVGRSPEWLHVRYEYAGDRVVVIERAGGELSSGARPTHRHRYELTYGKIGKAMYVEDAKRRSLAFTFDIPGAAVRASDTKRLLAEIETALVDAIPPLVRRFKAPAKHRAYALVLNYAHTSCIPTLALGFAGDGESVKPPAGRVSGKDEWRWNPADMSSHASSRLALRSKAFERLDIAFQQATREEELDVRALTNRVAKRLGGIAWAPLPVTKSFIVYAVDDDLADLSKNLAFVRRR